MSMTDALALSPNTAFAKLIRRSARWPHGGYGGPVGTAFYAELGTAHTTVKSDESLADYIQGGRTSLPVHALTVRGQCAGRPTSPPLPPGGTCRPAQPDRSVFRPHGSDVAVPTSPASRSRPDGLAASRCPMRSPSDTTMARRGRQFAGWGLAGCRARPAPPNRNRSSAFVGYTNQACRGEPRLLS